MAEFRLPGDIYISHRYSANTLSDVVDWSLKLFKVPDRWTLSRGAGIRAAVLDTGCDIHHPDLAGAIKHAKDFTRSRHGVQDVNGHGTHCCGIIGARQNGIGVVGVAPECDLLVGKVLGDHGSGSGEQVAAGIYWAVECGAHIISMSLGSPHKDPAIAAAIEYAVTQGVFVISAAGNSGQQRYGIDYPAKFNGRPRVNLDTIAVAAVDKDGRVTAFSSRGEQVDIAAPGFEMLSCAPGGGYVAMSGTSMATPFVAGIETLLLAYHATGEHATPIKTMADMRLHLQRTAIDAGEVGHDDAYGFGLINPETMFEPLAGEQAESAGVTLFIPGAVVIGDG